MKQTKQIFCPHCECGDLVKNGLSSAGNQRFRCNGCKKYFQTDYTYNARQPGIKEKIENLTLNSSGVRDIARNLGINKNTVIAHLKKKRRNK